MDAAPILKDRVCIAEYVTLGGTIFCITIVNIVRHMK